MSEPIAVIDFFAGPGGLGEGFATFRTEDNQQAFEIALSVEKDPSARASLRLRSFFRQFGSAEEVPESYYDYLIGRRDAPWDRTSKAEWRKSDKDAMCATLGDPDGDERIDAVLKRLRLERRKWALIGGPPCQAYSLVGRSRNAGNADYSPENDERHFLYQHYLRALHAYRPAAFVLENVKGVLSSKVAGVHVFPRMLADLAEPTKALGVRGGGQTRYRIHAAASAACFEPGMTPSDVDVSRYVVRCEEHGLGQARHRVILIGVREDISVSDRQPIARATAATAAELIGDLQRIRSGLSRTDDGFDAWLACVRSHATRLRRSCAESGLKDLARALGAIALAPSEHFPEERIGRRMLAGRGPGSAGSQWRFLRDKRMRGVILNHEARSHMESDLGRYLFCAAYALQYGESPKASDFPRHLHPEHSSWGTGSFEDRFRAQVRDRPSTTITSHISKDGHYFIHYDPYQCRSLTVREAARLQGFPDNYFFEGNRTQQYVQVGNAVPPPLAKLIAAKVFRILKG